MPLTDKECPNCERTLHTDEVWYKHECNNCGQDFEGWELYDEETKIATVFYHFVHDFRPQLTKELETIEEEEDEKEVSDLHNAVRFVKKWSEENDRSTIVRHADKIIENSGIEYQE